MKQFITNKPITFILLDNMNCAISEELGTQINIGLRLVDSFRFDSNCDFNDDA